MEKANLLIKSVDGSIDIVLNETGLVIGVTCESINAGADGFSCGSGVGPFSHETELLGGERGGSINEEPANVIWKSDRWEEERARGVDTT